MFAMYASCSDNCLPRTESSYLAFRVRASLLLPLYSLGLAFFFSSCLAFRVRAALGLPAEPNIFFKKNSVHFFLKKGHGQIDREALRQTAIVCHTAWRRGGRGKERMREVNVGAVCRTIVKIFLLVQICMVE